MGVVYTPEEVAHAEVPQPGAHLLAAKHFLAACEQSDYILAAQIHGSTLTVPKRRSDMDVVSVYPLSESHAAADDRCRMIEDVWDRYHVKTECHSIPSAGELHFPDRDIFFARYLLDVAKGSPDFGIGGPEAYIQRIQVSASPEEERLRAFDYVHAKSGSMNRALDNNNLEYDTLQRAFELVSALGRKLVPFLQHAAERLAGLEYPLDDRDKMTIVVTQGLGIVATLGYNVEPLVSYQQKLATLDSAYTKVLEDTLAGNLSVSQYEKWISDNYRPALQSALGLSDRWIELMAKITENQ